ncbi:hypothetical protein DL769_009274 [Monosporascus sp. CRB-8-3]|nr:hypothetical protein DL769_009274 [Monosporascus sp. CRB-8-3]
MRYTRYRDRVGLQLLPKGWLSGRYGLGALIALTLFSCLTLGFYYVYLRAANRPHIPVFPLGRLSLNDVCDNSNKTPSTPYENDIIPNFVHYVWLLRDPAIFSLNFPTFLSMYSAHVYFRPERIYIHTDASESVFNRAKVAGDLWTRRVLALPGITYHHVQAPPSTAKGVAIKLMEHKADFLRIEALRDSGGIYLDTDAVPLRDVSHLRKSGFAAVVGGVVALAAQHTGFMNNGVLMSRPRSKLLDIWLAASHEVFDGQWETASIHLLTDLVYRLVAIPGEVLVLHPRAFAPISWEFEDQKRLFKPHLGTTPTDALQWLPDGAQRKKATLTEMENGNGTTCRDMMAYLREREEDGKVEKWEMDFSSTYVLHAFDGDIPRMSGWDHEVNLRYVLARQSNYARAVFPAVLHAIKEGVIPLEEVQEQRESKVIDKEAKGRS